MSNFKFAHLLGLKKKAAEEDDDDKEKSKKAKSRRAEDERDDKEEAEDDDDREDMEDDESDPDAEEDDEKDKTSKKGKKAKSNRAENDEDDADAEDDDENRDVKKGRRAERKRCAAIFGSKHATGRPDMAAHLAFNTQMSASEAISTLATMGSVAPSRKVSLDERMNNAQVRLGPDAKTAPAGSANAIAERAISLYNSTRSKK